MTCKESKALCFLFQKHFAKIAVSKANLTGVCYGTGDTESLKSFTDGGGSVRSLAAAFLDGDGSAYGISPAGIFEADGLNFLNLLINVESGVLGNFFGFFNRRNAVRI